MAKVRIVGAIANKTGITLYQEDGTSTEIRSDAFSTKAIMNVIQPKLALGKVAEVDLDAYSAEKMIEEKTGGMIRFMKLAGDAVKALFKKQGVNENQPHAFQVDVPRETTVAVVNDVQIPGMEKLANQINHAAITGNVEGLKRFMERLAVIVEQRGHTAQELLNFIQKGDLPIADDGSIIAYKRLYRHDENRYVDPHTRRVVQRVGSLVKMDEEKVDKNRRAECSTGLHIGRRDYMGSFNGDVICVTKVNPEDVIAVPANEGRKMRTAAYHIVAEVNPAAFKLLCSNRPMTDDPESATLLANIIKGNHVEILEVVEVGAAGESKAPVVVKEDAAPVMLEQIKATTVDQQFEALSPKELNKRTDQIIQEAAASGDMSAAVSDEDVVEAFKAPVEKPVKAKKAKSVDPKPKVAVIDDRDQKVIDLVKAGKSHREVERITGVSARSVRRILDKHGLRGK